MAISPPMFSWKAVIGARSAEVAGRPVVDRSCPRIEIVVLPTERPFSSVTATEAPLMFWEESLSRVME
jgi:hypothetical protein